MERVGCKQIGESRSSVNRLTGFSPVQMAPIQEGGAASSIDVAEFTDTAEAGRTGTTASSSRARSVCIESESEADSGNAHTTTERYP